MSLQGSGCMFIIGMLFCGLFWGFYGAFWWTVASVIVTILSNDD